MPHYRPRQETEPYSSPATRYSWCR